MQAGNNLTLKYKYITINIEGKIIVLKKGEVCAGFKEHTYSVSHYFAVIKRRSSDETKVVNRSLFNIYISEYAYIFCQRGGLW